MSFASFAFSSHVLRAASSAALRAGRSCGAHSATQARCASMAATQPRHSAAAAHAYACLVHRRSMVARSSPAGGPGQVSGPLMEQMTAKISAALGTSDVSVKDQGGDGRHVSIDVVSPLFEGKSAVDRQRMVYKAIWQELQETVHAVDSMTTRAPSEV